MPYLGRAIASLTPVRREGLNGMTIDKYWRLYYDPNLLETWEWGTEAAAGKVLQMVYHLIRKHRERGEQLRGDPKTFAVAATIEVTDDLKEEEIPLPGNTLYPEVFKFDADGLAEDYYYKLVDKVNEGELSIVYGSGIAGSPKPFEEGAPNETVPGLSEASAEAVQKQVAEDIQQRNNSRGDVPESWRQWANNNLTPPVIPWQKLLGIRIRRCISTLRGNVDFSYARFSRRQGARQDIRLPAMIKPDICVGVLVDSSGSMSKEMVDRALSESVGIARAAGSTVLLVVCDAKVHSVMRLQNTSGLKKIQGGGGGTDLRKGLEELGKHKITTAVVITDGDTPWPEIAPRFPVIVGLVRESRTPCPAWASVVLIKEKENA